MNTKTNVEPEDENPEKYFDASNYSTLLVGQEKFATPRQLLAEDIITALTSGDSSIKDKALQLLKEQKAQRALVESIEESEDEKIKSILVAACWESGLEFNGYSDYFAELAGDQNPLLSLEAITVLDQMENFKKEDLEKLIAALEVHIVNNHTNKVLLEDLSDRLRAVHSEMEE